MRLARAYAKALFLTAKERNASSAELDTMERDLSSVALAVVGSKEARVALIGPAVSAKEKMAVITAFAEKLGTGQLVGNFLKLLARKERLGAIHQIADAFKEVRLESEGGCLGQAVSAEELSAADIEALALAFGKKLGKKVKFQTSTNSELLAGVKVTIGGVTYDGTLRSQMTRLRDRLTLSVNTETVH